MYPSRTIIIDTKALILMKRFFRSIIFFFSAFAILGVAAIAVLYFVLAPQLPSTDNLKEVQLQVPLRVFSSEGLLIAEFGDKRRIPIEYRDIPEQMVQAILASEDDRFFEHPGVDYQGLLRAAYGVITTGKKTQGGSTITMQLARNFFLGREKTYLRKLNEIILSLQIEHKLTKQEILALYLNKIFLGNRAYGVSAAAKVYYGKDLSTLNLAQFAMIAGLPKAPSKFNPVVNPDRAKLRRDYVLRRMFELNKITEPDFLAAKAAPVTARYHQRDIEVHAPFVAEMVRTQMLKEHGKQVYNNGYRVYTTLRAPHQRAANDALQNALLAYDRRHGFRGPISHISLPDPATPIDLETVLTEYDSIGPLVPALVLSIKDNKVALYVKQHGAVNIEGKTLSWARPYLETDKRGNKIKSANDVLTAGDVVFLSQQQATSKTDDNAEPTTTTTQWQLAQLPLAQGALIAVSPFDGAVTALNGGFDFFQSKFNRVIQSQRQPGSGFKPFLYSAALENGYTAATLVNDAPVVFDGPGLAKAWRPANASGKFFGPTRLRVALTHSRNLVSIRLLRDLGIPTAMAYIQRFGFDKKQIPQDLSMALGSGSARPWDMARAYATLANGGYLIDPYFIQRIEDGNGNILMQAEPATVCDTCSINSTDTETTQTATTPTGFKAAPRIITAQNAYIMNSMLRDVVRFGTGRRAMKLNRKDLAGKTGTTNDQVDAWFNGFHPELVAISWVGFDTPATLGRGEYGGVAALPMWMDFMKVALDGIPDAPLKKPDGMVTVKIDSKTGLLAHAGTEKIAYETFRSQFVPAKSAPLTLDSGGAASSAADLF